MCIRDSSLKSIDLGLFSRLTEIPGSLLCNCKSLTTIDLSPLSNVRHISGNFLSNCRRLTSIDLSPLSNVVSIDSGFPVSYTHLRAHETVLDLVCRLLLEKKKKNDKNRKRNY
eukprot:TRINITY_DN21256_c0_g1_i1.p1 TRINITY_DN21256_c0_g1~~TRINITY_DN21256_c0_g1_i1.p1  ORF type:complete len:120 (-),score=24.63 TRINITY_DN21256_c0_g1_i1:47-385(-)